MQKVPQNTFRFFATRKLQLLLLPLAVIVIIAACTSVLKTGHTTKAVLLSEPFLQLPTQDSVRVVWFTEFAGSQHTVAYGEGLNRTIAATRNLLILLVMILPKKGRGQLCCYAFGKRSKYVPDATGSSAPNFSYQKQRKYVFRVECNKKYCVLTKSLRSLDRRRPALQLLSEFIYGDT